VRNAYHFTTRWRVVGTCGEVADVLDDPLSLPRWWPSVYLEVWQLRSSQRAAGSEPGEAGPASEREQSPASSEADNRVGRRVKLHTKGWLPYTLRWQLEIVESRYPYGFTLIATGDFDGRGEWTFVQNGPFVDMTYDWRLRAEKPLLRNLSFLMKPIFKANHQGAMARGEESLKIELARRRATSRAARAAIPPPPGPVTYTAAGLIAGAAIIGGTLAYLVFRATRKASSSRREA